MNRRMIVFFFPLIILLLATTCAAQKEETDQWIYDAVAYLSQLDFGELYADVNPENRFQVSLAIANTIQRLEQNSGLPVQRFGVSRRINLKELFDSYNQRTLEHSRLPEQAMTSLALLADEYRDELNILGYWIEDLPSLATNQTDSAKASAILESNLYGAGTFAHLLNGSQTSVFKSGSMQDLDKSSVLSKYFGEDEDEEERILINSLIPLWSSDWFIGAGLSLPALPKGEQAAEEPGYAGIIGEYLINPGLVLEGQYLHNLSQPLDPGVLQFGARGRLGNVTLRGLVQTGEDESEGAKASLDITYTTANSILIRAGFYTNLKPVSQLGFSASTGIDVDIPIPHGRIALGLVQRWNNDSLDEENSDAADRTRASIEFSYDLTKDVSFKLDYRLIDFSDVNKALAEFSIRF
ncbi:MAG TPA: hypothetical protein PLW17_06295 [Limnochordia bacterium]|nr:hypothetical protein [Bacillota bacterium]HOB08864.1 hypothetical protein [Limnochordia bacterium]HPZ31046.1 hypothetical protein [Limnochordia bacterium]HQD69775.1 hypothetical protein [Limnochordia bacterium]